MGIHTSNKKPFGENIKNRDRGAIGELCFAVLQSFCGFILAIRRLVNLENRGRAALIERITNEVDQTKHFRNACGPDIPVGVHGEIVDRHAYTNSIDLLQFVLRGKAIDADVWCCGHCNVYESFFIYGEAVGESKETTCRWRAFSVAFTARDIASSNQ